MREPGCKTDERGRRRASLVLRDKWREGEVVLFFLFFFCGSSTYWLPVLRSAARYKCVFRPCLGA